MLTPFFLSGLTLLVTAQAPSQVLDLQTAVREALERNPELHRVEAAARAAAASVPGARSWPEPTLTYQAWQQPFSRPFNPTATNMHMFGVRQTLPFPGQLGRAGDASEAMANARRAEAKAARLTLEAQVSRGLVGLWLVNAELAAHQAHIELGRRTLEATKARYIAGQAIQADVLRVETELHLLHSSIEALREATLGAAAFLNVSMGRPADAPVPRVADPEHEIPAGDAERPEVTAATYREAEARATASLARLERYVPQFMVGFDYMLMPGIPDAYAVMVQIPLPFLSGRRAAEDERARESVSEATLARASVQNTVRYEIVEAHARAAAANAQLQVLEHLQIRTAERTLAATQAAYAAGQSSLLSLLDAQSTLLEARLLLVRQRAALGTAIADLRRALGHDVLPEEPR